MEWTREQIICLNPKHLRVLREFKRWTIARIAQECGVSINTIEARLNPKWSSWKKKGRKKK